MRSRLLLASSHGRPPTERRVRGTPPGGYATAATGVRRLPTDHHNVAAAVLSRMQVTLGSKWRTLGELLRGGRGRCVRACVRAVEVPRRPVVMR